MDIPPPIRSARDALLRHALPVTIGAIASFAIAFWLFFPVWPEWLTFAYWQQGGGTTSRSEVIRNLGLLVVAAIGLGFGVWRAITAHRQTMAAQSQALAAGRAAHEQGRATERQAEAAYEQARITLQAQFTDRFAKAVELLAARRPPPRRCCAISCPHLHRRTQEK